MAAATWVSSQLKQNAVNVVVSVRARPAADKANAVGKATGSSSLVTAADVIQFKVPASCSSDQPICSVSRRNSIDSRLARNQEFQYTMSESGSASDREHQALWINATTG